jgi:hypothetical protein
MTTSDFDNYINDLPQENMHHAPMLSHFCCLPQVLFFGVISIEMFSHPQNTQ